MANPRQSSTSPAAPAVSGRSHGRATLADVARRAGVTTMTVSRFLRLPQRVAQATSDRISRALAETGYTPNAQAASLASGRSRVVGVIVPNIAHSIFADTLQGLEHGLHQLGLQMIVASSGYDLAQEEAHLRYLLGWAPAALVVTGRSHSKASIQLLASSQQAGIPVVEIWDQSPADETALFTQIGFNHHHAGTMMAQALIERGCRELVFLDTGTPEDTRAHERAAGFLAEARQRGCSAGLITAEEGDPAAQGALCLANWLQNRSGLGQTVGWACANDGLAIGAAQRARQLGYDSLTVLGFGNFPASRYLEHGLNTVRIDGEHMGLACARSIGRSLALPAASKLVGFDAPPAPSLLWRTD